MAAYARMTALRRPAEKSGNNTTKINVHTYFIRCVHYVSGDISENIRFHSPRYRHAGYLSLKLVRSSGRARKPLESSSNVYWFGFSTFWINDLSADAAADPKTEAAAGVPKPSSLQTSLFNDLLQCKLIAHIPLSPAGDTGRNLSIPINNSLEIINLIRRSTDFTFSTTLKQDTQNVGTIISFKIDDNDR